MAVKDLRNTLLEAFKRYRFLYRCVHFAFRFTRNSCITALRKGLGGTQTFGYPQGFFSGVEAVRAGRNQGRVVLESQTAPNFGEATLVSISKLGQDRHQPWPVFWMSQKDAYLSGPTLCLRNKEGKLLAEATYSQKGSINDPAYSHFAKRPDLYLDGNVTSLLDWWTERGYFHWLMDGIARLALLPELPPDTKILVRPLSEWKAGFLRNMGLEGRLIETKSEAVHIENYHFLAPSSMTGCWNPFAVQFLRDTFLPTSSALSGTATRFYIVREGFTRGIRNDSEVREFFLKRGWSLVAPETLSVSDQINLFSKARAIVAMHGSALTNLIWCSPGCQIFELVPDNHLTGAFEIAARMLHLRHDFLICEGDYRSHIQIDLKTLDCALQKAGL